MDRQDLMFVTWSCPLSGSPHTAIWQDCYEISFFNIVSPLSCKYMYVTKLWNLVIILCKKLARTMYPCARFCSTWRRLTWEDGRPHTLLLLLPQWNALLAAAAAVAGWQRRHGAAHVAVEHSDDVHHELNPKLRAAHLGLVLDNGGDVLEVAWEWGCV